MSRRRGYDRSARLSGLLLEIIAEKLEAMDAPELSLVTITGVDVDSDLNRAVVYFATMGRDPAEDAGIQDALSEHRRDLRRAIASQAHLRNIPDMIFRPDQGLRHGAHIEEVLRDLQDGENGGRHGSEESEGGKHGSGDDDGDGRSDGHGDGHGNSSNAKNGEAS